MNDIEISHALALAIGWTDDRLDENGCLDPDVIIEGSWRSQESGVFVWRDDFMWERFDYRDPVVIWPIAERYNCFPSLILSGHNEGKWISFSFKHAVTAETPFQAVALAIIGNNK